ncbi:MAG: alpha/beta hydrolase [Candidatus Kariarchaeaceae archaeon]
MLFFENSVEKPPKEYPRYYSQSVDDDFLIYVSYPDNFQKKKLPTMYILDANFRFHQVVDLVSTLQNEGLMPEIVLVGVGYPDGTQRSRDYLYYEDHPQTGDPWGAPDFYEFMTTELIPFIDETYNTDPDNRSIIGVSYSASFTVYAMLQYREESGVVFTNYITSSPQVYPEMLEFEEKMASTGINELPFNLFIGVGSTEPISLKKGIWDLESNLNSRNYLKFNYTIKVYEGLSHSTVVLPCWEDGLQWAFSGLIQ